MTITPTQTITTETSKPKRTVVKTALYTTLLTVITLGAVLVGTQTGLVAAAQAADTEADTAIAQAWAEYDYTTAQDAVQARTEATVKAFAAQVKNTLATTTPEKKQQAFDTLVKYSQVPGTGSPKMVGTPEHYIIELTVAASMGDDTDTAYYALNVWGDDVKSSTNITEIM